MSWLYRRLLRPALFAEDAETIHARTLRSLNWVSRHPLACEALESFLAAPDLAINLFGLRFPNPIGLAAGMDKLGEAVPAWAALGFGFSELGGVTWHAQPGNPAPRVFRAVADEAIVNRILDDIVKACRPKQLIVRGKFAPRGGIQLTCEARHPDRKDRLEWK